MACFPWQRGAVLAALLLAATAVLAQDYPSKPIRIVVGFPPGGLMDILARVVAKPLEERLKSPVVIDNRPGAGGLVGASAVVRAEPDGYTLTHIAPSTVSKVFIKDPPFDFFNAFRPVASFWENPFVLSINSQIPAATAKEFVDYAKANPGKLNSACTNGPNCLPMALFASIAGIKLQSIEYKGATQMHTALLTNEIQATFNTLQSLLPYLDSGKVRVLAVTGNQRLRAIPNVPTTTEAGYPGMQGSAIGGIFAPAGVPDAVIAKLSPILKDIVASPEVEKILSSNGRPLIVGAEELMRLLREEEAIWANAARVAGFKPQ